MKVFDKWVCTFPGKMGLSWKLASPYDTYDSKELAEAQAVKNCNVVAVPLRLFEKIKEHERRLVRTERFLYDLGLYESDLEKIQGEEELDQTWLTALKERIVFKITKPSGTTNETS